MTKSTKTLLIVFGILLLVLGYQVFFTDAYDGLFGSPSAPTVLPAPERTQPVQMADTEPEIAEPHGDSPAGAPERETNEPERVTVGGNDARFRSEQLLRDVPGENPFRSITNRPSALFDPSASGATVPLSSSASALVLENGGTNDSQQELEHAGTATSRTPQRVHSAPVARLTVPVPDVSPVTPMFTSLFDALSPAPLIRTTRQAVASHAVQLPTSLPSAPVVQFDVPVMRSTVMVSDRVSHATMPYFTDLDIYPVIAFTTDNRHADRASVPFTARIRDLQRYFEDIDLTFTGTARGSVTVGVFRSTVTLGPVVLAVGQTLPETEITLTRLTTTEAEFTLGDQTRVLTLNLRW